MVDPSENKIHDAIETISPSSDAHDRMLARIRAKAAQQENDLAPVSSDIPETKDENPEAATLAREADHITTVAHPSHKGTANKSYFSIRELRSRLLVLAACFMLVIGSVALYAWVIRKRVEPKQTETLTNGGQVPFSKTFSSTDELEMAVGIRLIAPAKSTEVLYFYDQEGLAGVRFTQGINMYYLYAYKGGRSVFETILADCVELPTADLHDATFWESEDKLTKAITWSDGALSYCLFNSDDAAVDEFRNIYEEIRK